MSSAQNQTESPILTVDGIKITAEPGITISQALSATPFTNWLAAVDRQRFVIRAVHFQSLDIFGSRVGFIKFKADVVDAQGRFIPGIVFARGGAVAVLAVLICEGEAQAVVTVQPRLPTGRFEFVEVCAGMLDGSGNFKGVAAKELKEELEIEVSADQLTDLTALAGCPDGIYLSPGGSDETIRIFAFCRTVSRDELQAINGRVTGVLAEGEQITLRLVSLDSLGAINDAKTIAAYALFQRFRDRIVPLPSKS